MSRRTIVALAASAIFGMGFILMISTEASAYYRGGVYRGGVYRGGVYRGGYYRGVRPGVTVGVVLLQSVLPRSEPPPRVLITRQVIMRHGQ